MDISKDKKNIIGIPKKEDRESGMEEISEVIIVENISKLMTDDKPRYRSKGSESTRQEKYHERLHLTISQSEESTPALTC